LRWSLSKGKNIMRNLILAGAAGLAFAFGAVSADAQSIQARPQSSSYALVQPLDAAPTLSEGRSAFTSQVGVERNVDVQVRGGSFKTNGPVPQLDAR
jgi:hypothetical protein